MNETRIEPRNGRVYVRPIASEMKSESGVHMLESTQERRHILTGEVVATCKNYYVNGRSHQALCEVGDTVAYNQYNTEEFVLDGEFLMVMKLEEIVGVVKPALEGIEPFDPSGEARMSPSDK